MKPYEMTRCLNASKIKHQHPYGAPRCMILSKCNKDQKSCKTYCQKKNVCVIFLKCSLEDNHLPSLKTTHKGKGHAPALNGPRIEVDLYCMFLQP